MIVMNLAIVVIGRNESERIKECFESVASSKYKFCYIDSNSSDDSISIAKKYTNLTSSIDTPFSAGKARNKGVELIKQSFPGVKYIQFIDGDCVIDSQWIERAKSFLTEHKDSAVVCGIRKEKSPIESIYNRLCEYEWNPNYGSILGCGGDFMVKLSAFDEVNGFDSRITAGEEPELCLRIRTNGWKIYRLHIPMSTHDANIESFKQYAKRVQRAGYAFTYGFFKHFKILFNLRPVLRILFWGIFLPLLIVTVNYKFLFLYLIQFLRLFVKSEIKETKVRVYQAFFLSFGKFFEAIGMLKAIYVLFISKSPNIIEYK